MNTLQTNPLQRNLIMAVVICSGFVSVLNQTLLLIAIPPIMEDFHIEPHQGQWLTTVFMLANGIMIPLTAFLTEKFSDRRLLMTALSIFATGTFLGSIAPTFSVLLLARIIQGIGAGILMPLMHTVILTLFPPEKRGTAMGFTGLVIGFGPAIGPTVSGLIIGYFSWRYLFYLVLPAALLALLLAFRLMKNVTLKRQNHIDIPSIILSTFGWGGLLYGFSMVGTLSWTSSHVLLPLLVGGVSLILFIRRQFKLDIPILEFRVFKSSVYVLTTLLIAINFAIMVSTQTILSIYAQDVLGITAYQAGLALLPGGIILGVMSPVTGRIFDRFGGRGLAIGGFTSIVLSTIGFTSLSMETSITLIAFYYALLTLGMSMILMPLAAAGVNSLPAHLIAHGTAMNNTVRMIGGSIGTALLISVMSSQAAKSVAADPLIAMLDGIHTSFMVSCFFALIGLGISFTLKKKQPQNMAS